MEPISVGFYSIIPPLIAIGLALITKEVISSLIVGIISGTIIYSIATNSGAMMVFSAFFELMFSEFSVSMIIFLALLGALISVVTMAGGSKAYGEWASKKIGSRAGAQLATTALGSIIFIDDYFNCLTVGTVMRPVTDKHKISREKLAYLIDATAAPICIIAPISSWAASVMLYMSYRDLNGFNTFIQTIPFNLYAILTLIMMVTLSLTNLDFGPMLRFEKRAQAEKPVEENRKSGPEDELADIEISEKGRVFDLLIPIFSLIVFSILGMLYTGGYFGGGMSIAEAFGDTDANMALCLGGFGALIVAGVLYLSRGIMNQNKFMGGVVIGIKSMVPAFVILTLAWTIKAVCGVLSTGEYVSGLVSGSNITVALLPAIIFIVAAFLSFSTGTSWGTFGILIPIVIDIAFAVSPELMVIMLAATLAGSVFGDHCSPISDTTILSSIGARCNHIDHVQTQIPYALTVAACSIIGFIVAGFTKNVWLTLAVSIALLAGTLIVMNKLSSKKLQANS